MRSATPFYCYSTATLEPHYRCSSDAFADEKALVCYAMKGQLEFSRCCARWRNSAPARTCFGWRAERAAGRRHSACKDFVSGIARARPSCARALSADVLCINVESEPELELLSRLARETAGPRESRFRVIPTSIPARTQKSRPASPRTIRRTAGPCACGLTPAPQKCRVSRSPAIDMISQPDHRSGAAGSSLQAAGRIRADATPDGHTISAYRFRGRARHSYHAIGKPPAGARSLCRDVKRVTHNLGCTLMFEPGRMIVGMPASSSPA